MEALKPGDRVIRTEADEPDCLPGMHIMFGTVVEPSQMNIMWVHVMWDCDRGHAPSLAHPSWIRHITPEEEQARRTKAFPFQDKT
jgi:hypothetical protein